VEPAKASYVVGLAAFPETAFGENVLKYVRKNHVSRRAKLIEVIFVVTG